jgi:DNA-binding transcriptional LysR family regulator
MATTLDPEHLRSLVAIAECGGFGRAAAVRHMSQPALSQHIRLLERNLDRKLFVRDGRVMKFTPDGQQLLNEARHILAAHDAALERLQADTKRSIAVGSAGHSADQLLPAVLRSFVAGFPDYTLRFEIARSPQLADAVTKGTLDLAFVLGPVSGPTAHAVGELPLHWYAAPDWEPPSSGDPMPLVAFEEPCQIRERATRALSDIGVRTDVSLQAGTLEGLLAGVRAGLGVALLPSAGGKPPGLVVRKDLPATGSFGLHMAVRQGLDSEIEATALKVCRDFFQIRRPLRLLDTRVDQHARTHKASVETLQPAV